MVNNAALPRKLLIFLLVLPLAGALGYMLATPDDLRTSMLVGMVASTLLAPLFLRWHHAFLVFGWNAAMSIFFLPGQPQLWMVLAGISFGISVLERLLTKKQTGTFVPSVAYSLLFLAAVVVLTAKMTGGIGFRSMGGQTFGGRWYFYILFAILGYFAFTSQRIAPEKAVLFVLLFFGSALTAMVSNLAYFGGPNFYFLYFLFPVDLAMQQAMADWAVTGFKGVRLSGLAQAAPALTAFMLVKYGIKGVLDAGKPWRMLIVTASIFLGLLGGYRSNLIMFFVLFAVLFYLERLHRTRFLLVFALVGVIGAALLFSFSTKLPFSVQRSVSFLPVKVDPAVKYDADLSTDWRLRMWKVLLPEVPKYLLRGKGYAMDPTELYLMQEAISRGFYSDVDSFVMSGSYHSGPLTLIIPFGIWGVIAFAWFAIASLKVLYKNYANSPPNLKLINTFLLAFFIMRLFYFIFIYGQFGPDLFMFTGVVGLSVSLNGAAQKRPLPVPEPLEETAPNVVPAVA